MKKILLGLVMLVTAATMSAQIELELVLDGGLPDKSLSMPSSHINTPILYGMNDMYVVTGIDETLQKYTYHVYTSNGELCATYVEEAAISPWLITKNIFTTNDKICFVSVTQGQIIIYDEDRNIISEIPTYPEGLRFALQKTSNGYKLLSSVWSGDWFKTYVYSCPGNGETITSVENVPAKVKRNAYPNPASDLVTLPYEVDGATSMKIYDIQGKLVDRKFLDKSKQELQLNVKDYPSGMYFFEVNGESNSFIVD